MYECRKVQQKHGTDCDAKIIMLRTDKQMDKNQPPEAGRQIWRPDFSFLSPDVIPCGWLGSKRQLTNYPSLWYYYVKAPILYRAQSYDLISCYGNSVKWTDEISCHTWVPAYSYDRVCADRGLQRSSAVSRLKVTGMRNYRHVQQTHVRLLIDMICRVKTTANVFCTN